MPHARNLHAVAQKWPHLACVQLSALVLQVVFDPIIMLSNAAAAFGLNMSVFLLIGKVRTSSAYVRLSVFTWLKVATRG